MLSIELVKKDDRSLIANLLQFYMFELNQLSQHKYFELAKDGKYQQYPYFENYWSENNRLPYAVKLNNLVIGFSLVHDITIIESMDWKLAEFFIMPEFRDKGIGTEAAIKTIQSHQGKWEISVLKDNPKAKAFWLHVFKKLSMEYEVTDYPEYEVFSILR
jgi:predicted acetyltransferase